MKPERIEELRVLAARWASPEEGTISCAIRAREAVWVSLDPAELLHLLRCARVVAELEQTLRDIAEDTGCAYPVTVTKKNPRSVQYEFGVADGHRVAAAKARAALARAKEGSCG